MAKAKRSKTSKKKPYVKRRKQWKRQKMLTLRPGRTLFPDSIRVKLRYESGAVSVDAGAGVPAVHKVCANGLYDPDVTGTGHQPRGFDQVMPFYTNYVVTGAKITAHFISLSTSQPNIPVVGVSVRSTSATVTDILDFTEDRKTRWKIMSTSDGSKGVVKVQGFFSAKKWFGMGYRQLLADHTKNGSESANPTDGVFFHLFTHAANDSTDITDIKVRYVVEYTAVMVQPKSISAS